MAFDYSRAGKRPIILTEPFIVGETYQTQAGDNVKCVELSGECARFSDGGTVTYIDWNGIERSDTSGWRYNRQSTDHGRVTGTAHDWSDPNNIIPRKSN